MVQCMEEKRRKRRGKEDSWQKKCTVQLTPGAPLSYHRWQCLVDDISESLGENGINSKIYRLRERSVAFVLVIDDKEKTTHPFLLPPEKKTNKNGG